MNAFRRHSEARLATLENSIQIHIIRLVTLIDSGSGQLSHEMSTAGCITKGMKTFSTPEEHAKDVGHKRSEIAVMESVVLETVLGEITLELYWDHAPKASDIKVSGNDRLM